MAFSLGLFCKIFHFYTALERIETFNIKEKKKDFPTMLASARHFACMHLCTKYTECAGDVFNWDLAVGDGIWS